MSADFAAGLAVGIVIGIAAIYQKLKILLINRKIKIIDSDGKEVVAKTLFKILKKR